MTKKKKNEHREFMRDTFVGFRPKVHLSKKDKAKDRQKLKVKLNKQMRDGNYDE